MIYATFLLAAAAATASAQVVYNATTGKFICPVGKPNGAFCASSDGDGSLKTNIIIRCHDGFGQPGNCNDNLAGYFPFGVNYAPCYQTSIQAGDAACSKNCEVHGEKGTFVLPNCVPVPPPSSSSSTASSTGYPTSKSSSSTSSGYPTSSGSTSSGYPTSSSTSTIYTSTYTSTYCPPTTTSTSTYCPPTTTSTYIYPTGGSTTHYNTTVTTYTTSGVVTSATAKPVGPSGTTIAPPSTYTGAAAANTAGAGLGLAAIGVFAAYFL